MQAGGWNVGEQHSGGLGEVLVGAKLDVSQYRALLAYPHHGQARNSAPLLCSAETPPSPHSTGASSRVLSTGETGARGGQSSGGRAARALAGLRELDLFSLEK